MSSACPPRRHLDVIRGKSITFLSARPPHRGNCVISLRVLGGLSLEGAASDDAGAIVRQPKRMALLAYLACVPRGGFEPRDRILALFWPEFDDTRARHGLRQSLHVLRSALGAAAFRRRGDTEIALDPAVLSCDVALVLAALDDGRAADAVSLYRGDLLPGFHVSEAPEFERWLDDTRSRLRRRVSDAARGLSLSAERWGDFAAATQWARRAQELAPEDEAALRQLLTMLDRVGDRVGALQAYTEFVRRLRQDLDVEPTPETQQLVQELRRSRAAPWPEAVSPTGPRAHDTAVSEPVESRARVTTPRGFRQPALWLFAGAVAVSAIVTARLIGTRSTEDGPRPVVQESVAPVHPMAGAARLMYDQGMRAWSLGDRATAERLMGMAFDQDSTFGLAALQLGHLLGLRGEHEAAQRLQQRAAALSPLQSDHDRLLILALHSNHFNLPTQLAFAETLAIRYPADVEGQLLVAKARWMSGRYATAIVPLERVIATGSSGRDSTGERCLACEAYELLVVTYEGMDSLPAAERTARSWLLARPKDATAWNALSYQLSLGGRFTDAIAAHHRAADLAPAGVDGNALGEILLRAGDFRMLENILTLRERTGSTEDADGARFLRWRLRREQGRWREALALTDEMDRETRTRPNARGLAVALHAQSLLEAGRAAEAAAAWDSLARVRAGASEPAASAAIYHMSRLLRLSDAVASLGDTARLARMADSVQYLGRQGSWIRDHRMHHYIRGLIFAARGDHLAACDAFLSSLTGASTTFARANLAAGSHCLQAGRLQPALSALRGVLRGPIGAGGTSGTLTEAHGLVARVFDALQRPDSARAHHELVTAALRREDLPSRDPARAFGQLGAVLGMRPPAP